MRAGMLASLWQKRCKDEDPGRTLRITRGWRVFGGNAMHMFGHIWACLYMDNILMYIYVNMNTHTHTRAHTHTHVYVYMYIYIYGTAFGDFRYDLFKQMGFESRRRPNPTASICLSVLWDAIRVGDFPSNKLGFRGLGSRGLGFRGLGFRGLGVWGVGVWGLGFKA